MRTTTPATAVAESARVQDIAFAPPTTSASGLGKGVGVMLGAGIGMAVGAGDTVGDGLITQPSGE